MNPLARFTRWLFNSPDMEEAKRHEPPVTHPIDSRDVVVGQTALEMTWRDRVKQQGKEMVR